MSIIIVVAETDIFKLVRIKVVMVKSDPRTKTGRETDLIGDCGTFGLFLRWSVHRH